MRFYRGRFLLVPCLTLFLFIGLKASAQVPVKPVPHSEIWFTPQVPVDWLNMWTDDAPWQNAASKVKVIALEYTFIRQTTPAQLLQIAAFAKEHHIQLEIATDSVAKFQNQTCGGIEGYSFHGEILAAIQILQGLGIHLDWVDMDEPVWFGHYTPGPWGCVLSIPDLITDVALNMRDVLTAYPDIQMIELEPIPAVTDQPTWRQDLTQFRLGLAQTLGTAVHFVHADLEWNDPTWQTSLVTFNQYLREQNVGLGIFFNASSTQTTDQAWINAAAANMDTIEGQLGIIPAHAHFSTWNPNPTHNMPETSPLTQTWLINRFVNVPSVLQVQFSGTSANGKLTTFQGRPIANATIQGFIPGVSFSQPLPVTVQTGIVPATATSMILGIRINTECSNCNGLNDLLLGSIQYAETAGGSAQGTLSPPTWPLTQNGAIVGGQLIGGTIVSRIITQPGQYFLWNSNTFPVTPGATFQLSIPAGTVDGLGWSGNIDIIWISGAGASIPRLLVVPPVGKTLKSTAVTAADGTFQLLNMPRETYERNPVTVQYNGSGIHRSATWSPAFP
jgi:hypothetical protein